MLIILEMILPLKNLFENKFQVFNASLRWKLATGNVNFWSFWVSLTVQSMPTTGCKFSAYLTKHPNVKQFNSMLKRNPTFEICLKLNCFCYALYYS